MEDIAGPLCVDDAKLDAMAVLQVGPDELAMPLAKALLHALCAAFESKKAPSIS